MSFLFYACMWFSLIVMHGAPLGVPCGPRYQMILLSCYIVDSLLSSDHV